MSDLACREQQGLAPEARPRIKIRRASTHPRGSLLSPLPSLECAVLFDAVQVGALAQAAMTLLRANLPRPFNLSLLNLGGSNLKSDPTRAQQHSLASAWSLPTPLKSPAGAVRTGTDAKHYWYV